MTSCPICGGHILPDGSCMNNCGAYYPDREKSTLQKKQVEILTYPSCKKLLDRLHLHLRRLSLRAKQLLLSPKLGGFPTTGDSIDRATWFSEQNTCSAINGGFKDAVEKQIDTCTHLIKHLNTKGAWPTCKRCGSQIEWEVLVENPSEYCRTCNQERVRQRHGRFY